MRISILILTLVLSFYGTTTAQIKKIYDDQKVANRSNVLKDGEMDDYEILNQQFGDAEVGKVVRIHGDKPPAERPERIKPVRAPKENVAPPKPEPKETPKVDREPVSSGSSGSVSRERYKKKKKVRPFMKKRRKRVSRKKFTSCYRF